MDQEIGKYGNMATILSGFHTLKHLGIGGTNQKDMEAISLNAILNTCNSLVSLEHENRCD